MSQVEKVRNRGWGGRLFPVALLSVLLAGCGGIGEQELRATAAGGAPRRAATSTFQGAVTTVDFEEGTMSVAVRMVWAPVLEATSEQRTVAVDALTRWEPAPGGISQVRPGEEIQVEAEDVLDGTWRATRILLIDPD